MKLRPGSDSLLGLSLVLAGLIVPATASAELVKGKVVLPRAVESGRRYPGYWRVENGAVPVKSERSDLAVVILEGPDGAAPPARTHAITIEGLTPDKRVLVVGVGSVLEIKNNDKAAHDLSAPGQENLVPVERLAPGSMRRLKLSSPGAFEIRSVQYPSLAFSVFIVDHPYQATLGADGHFQIKDVPAGKATLKVWAHGKFVHEEGVTVSSASSNLTIMVESGSAPAAD